MELVGGFSHGGGPDLPVELGVGLAAVQRQAELVEFGFVVDQLGVLDLAVEEVQVEQVVPDEVVFLAPGVGAVKC